MMLGIVTHAGVEIVVGPQLVKVLGHGFGISSLYNEPVLLVMNL